MSRQHLKIDYFCCGSCSGNLGVLFRNHPFQNRLFPAGVFLLTHPEEGYILYDTGYDFQILQQSGWTRRLYRMVTPIQLTKEQQIQSQLKKSGIEPDEIRHVIVSHLHPDHVGGLRYFPNAHFYVSKESKRLFETKKLRDLIFAELFPADFTGRMKVLTFDKESDELDGLPVCDLFQDGKIWITSFDGHAPGQLAVFLPESRLMIASDVCWGIDLLPETEKMRWLPKMIQHDWMAYRQSAASIRLLLEKGIRIVVSHDLQKRVVKVLNET